MAESALWKGIFAPRRKGAGRRSEPVPVAAPPPPPPAAALDLAALAAEAFGAGTGVPAGPPAGFNATNRLAALQANSTITTPLYMTDSDDGLTLALDPEWAKGLEDVDPDKVLNPEVFKYMQGTMPVHGVQSSRAGEDMVMCMLDGSTYDAIVNPSALPEEGLTSASQVEWAAPRYCVACAAGCGCKPPAAAGAARAPRAHSSTSGVPPSVPPTTVTNTSTSAAQLTSQPQQFADGDPDSPYTDHMADTDDELIVHLDMIMFHVFKRMRWVKPIVAVPHPPSTAQEAGELQTQVDALLGEGRLHESLPWLCQLAHYSVAVLGQEHRDTLSAVHAVVRTAHECGVGKGMNMLSGWCAPRAARHWGLGHPDTRKVVWWAAQHLYESHDPRKHPEFTRTVTNVAKHLPGGLGWGAAVVAPLADDEAYNKHAVLQNKAAKVLLEHNYELGQKMLERCVSFYASVGPHWLCTPRKVLCKSMLGFVAARVGSPEDSEPLELNAKRTAQRELGKEHKVTLHAMWQYSETLHALGRVESAVSLCYKVLRMRKEILGARHPQVVECEVCISRLLITLDKPDAAEALLLDTFERALTSMSVQDLHLQEIPKALYQLLNAQGRTQEAEALKERATSLGIDASGCEPGCTCHVHLAQYLKMSKEEKAKYDARKRATMAQFAKLMREQQSAESLEALAMHESMV